MSSVSFCNTSLYHFTNTCVSYFTYSIHFMFLAIGLSSAPCLLTSLQLSYHAPHNALFTQIFSSFQIIMVMCRMFTLPLKITNITSITCVNSSVPKNMCFYYDTFRAIKWWRSHSRCGRNNCVPAVTVSDGGGEYRVSSLETHP